MWRNAVHISIHAPPRGATSASESSVHGYRFQFTPLREGRRGCQYACAGCERFQFTPLREGRHSIVLLYLRQHNFNSRPSARGDANRLFHLAIYKFQFTPLREGRPGVRVFQYKVRRFQFTPLREGRLVVPQITVVVFLFQFTPLREGRQQNLFAHVSSVFISIHAPPRGATADDTRTLTTAQISIHAPPRGATAMRGDSGTSDDISIHAPPRGATLRPVRRHCTDGLFQFTPLREGRRQKICNFCKSFVQPLQISMA